MDTNDALGNPIKIGSIYGYSNSSNGIINIFVGRAKHVTAKKQITLEDVIRRSGVYGELHEFEIKVGKKSSVSAYACHVFPITKETFDFEMELKKAYMKKEIPTTLIPVKYGQMNGSK